MGGADTHTDSQSTRNISHTHNHTSTAEILPSNGDEKDVEDSKWVIQIGFADNQKNGILLGKFSRFQGWEQGFPNFHGEPSREILESRTIRIKLVCAHNTRRNL